MSNIESTTWLDLFPAELVFLIFDYLSSNDIIYTFFFFNQRFNDLLLQNQCYLNYLELPTRNLNFWKNILSIIASRIECLNITTIDLSFSLTLFTNLKSIIISSPYGFPDEQFKLIFESEYFPYLHSFKIKENRLFSNRLSNNYLTKQDYVLKQVFSNKSLLETFQFPLKITPLVTGCENNLNLHSLTLILEYFTDVFVLISFTPNLKYLNVQSEPPLAFAGSIHKTNINLKELYLKLGEKETGWRHRSAINFDSLTNSIEQFSSSLTCLSLNLVGSEIRSHYEIPFDTLKFQQFLESMIQLKQFHIYARCPISEEDKDIILSEYQNQYWFDHNWSFGMHDKYFYTLPFHFDYLYEFYGNFDNVKLSNPDIEIINPRIWYNVKYIELRDTSIYDFNFLKQPKIKMPKLIFIKFSPSYWDMEKIEDININENKREKNNVLLDSVTTIDCARTNFHDVKEWLIHTLPNLNHLIISSTVLASTDSQLAEIFNKRIQQLDIDVDINFIELPELNYVHFANVQHIYFSVPDIYTDRFYMVSKYCYENIEEFQKFTDINNREFSST